jgi:hypothetical protein
VLGRFAEDPAEAGRLYERFIGRGIGENLPDLAGGGLVRSVGGWRYVAELRKGRERFSSDERILGSSRFVESTLAQMGGGRRARLGLDELIEAVCRAIGISADAVAGPGRPRPVSRARRGIAYLWTQHFGRSGREIAARLGLSPSSVHQAARLGRTEATYWLSVLRGNSGKPNKP